MKRSVLFVAVLIAVGLMTTVAEAQKKKARPKPMPMAKPVLSNYVHVVLFTMKKDTPKETIEQVVGDCHKMLGRIEVVRTLKVGRPAAQDTPKFAKKNYDLALLIIVDDYARLKEYLDHPIHEAFVKKHEMHFDMEKLQIFDFANQNK
jgi:hypothetical protein